jgi:DnaD/phage-associated family protein
MTALLKLLADDRRSITYRPRLNRVTGSVNATILFQQVLFRWEHNEGKPFYKFAAPAKDSKHYREGDSWQEEIGFTRGEFEGARKKIATAVEKGQSKDELLKEHAIVYWRDHQNLTWYDLNPALIEAMIAEAYTDAEKLQSGTDATIPIAENQQSRLQESSNLSDATFPQPSLLQESSNPISEIKNTTEITSKDEEPAAAASKNVFALLHEIWGRMVSGAFEMDQWKELESDFSIDWIEDAMKETVSSNGGRNIKYLRAILERWLKQGKAGGKLSAVPAEPKSYDTHEADYTPPPLVEVELTEEQKQAKADRDLWKRAFRQLALRLPKATFEQWVIPLKYIRRDGDAFVLEAGSKPGYDWLTEDKLHRQFVEVLTSLAGTPVEVIFTLVVADTSVPIEAAA